MSFQISLRIYYEDTDAGGVVYHANYLKFGERGRTEFLRHVGLSNITIQNTHGVIFVVRHIECHYLKPAFLEDEIILETEISSVKNSSFIMKHRVLKDDTSIFDMDVTLVCVDCHTYKPVRLPDEIKDIFLNTKD